MTPHHWRKLVNGLMFSLTAACALAAVCVLFWILGFLVWNGGRALNLDFFTQLPKPPGELGGGMANAIVGSAQIVLIAAAIGIPIGFLGGVYLAEFGSGAVPFFVRYTADLLRRVPSIVMGIFAYAIVVRPLPVFGACRRCRAERDFNSDHDPHHRAVLECRSSDVARGALRLGRKQVDRLRQSSCPAAIRGVATGMIRGIARIAGESAPAALHQFWESVLEQESYSSHPRPCRRRSLHMPLALRRLAPAGQGAGLSFTRSHAVAQYWRPRCAGARNSHRT
jgi:phosphate transport system permease protein